MVRLTGQLSNPSPSLRRMLEREKSLVSKGAAGRSVRWAPQKQVRLSTQQQEELVQRYRNGAFKIELARAFGIRVETVRAIITRQSTPLSAPRPPHT